MWLLEELPTPFMTPDLADKQLYHTQNQACRQGQALLENPETFYGEKKIKIKNLSHCPELFQQRNLLGL